MLVSLSGSKMCCSYGLYDADAVNNFSCFTCSLKFPMRSESLAMYGGCILKVLSFLCLPCAVCETDVFGPKEEIK